MNEITSKNNTIKTVLIVILSILLVGCIGFIAYDKLIKKEEPKTEENIKQEDNIVEDNKQESNYEEIDTQLKKLNTYINLDVVTDGKNAIGTSEGRILLVEYLVESKIYDEDEEYQPFAYTSYETFKATYAEIFGSSEKLDEDLKNVKNTPLAGDCSETPLKSTDKNLCWNSTTYTEKNTVLKSSEITKISDNNYKITGTYSSNNGDFNENGTFEIEYFKSNETKYLISIKLLSNN